MLFKQRSNNEALKLMSSAADMEDQTEKHPVTPCEVLPARELLGDMLMQMNDPAEALEAYQADLKRHPNRFNGVYGAGLAAEKSGKLTEAITYYKLLLTFTNPANADRAELVKTRLFLKKHNSNKSL
jgi:tetratricopeptide (TPR) repeat protein